MKSLCIRLSEEMLDQLELEAKRLGLKKTQIARMFLENYSNLEEKIYELEYELREQKEKMERYEEYVDNYYNKKSPYEIYGLNEEDFH